MSEGVLALPYHTRWNSTKRGDETLPGQRALLHFLLVAPMPLQNPTNPTMAGVFSVNKAFLVVGFCVWNPTMLTTNPTTRVVRRRVVSSGYQGG
jgi:hypothetical protein